MHYDYDYDNDKKQDTKSVLKLMVIGGCLWVEVIQISKSVKRKLSLLLWNKFFGKGSTEKKIKFQNTYVLIDNVPLKDIFLCTKLIDLLLTR